MIFEWPLFAMTCMVASLAAFAVCDAGEQACIADSKSIKVDFETRTLGVLVGEERTVHSTVTPEHCRAAVRLSVQGGSLPPGMHLTSDGHVSGTPLTEGTYRFRLAADSVRGQPIRPEAQAMVSGEMTLIVAHFHPDEE